MSFKARLANDEDKMACVKVEQDTMGNYLYLEDGWDYFMHTLGGLVCIENEQQMVGIGKLTVLPDQSAWLECLRVAPDFQNQGVGKMIYETWKEEAKKYHVTSMAMFTGTKNLRSSGLAERYGLKTVGEHQGYNLVNLIGGHAHQFKHITNAKALKRLLPLKDTFNDYCTFNRTFYHINEANLNHFGNLGQIYYDASSDSIIVCGARFQHHATLHIGMMDGNIDDCIDFAIQLAKAQGLEKITCTLALPHTDLEEKLIARGFEKEPGVIIVKEIVF